MSNSWWNDETKNRLINHLNPTADGTVSPWVCRNNCNTSLRKTYWSKVTGQTGLDLVTMQTGLWYLQRAQWQNCVSGCLYCMLTADPFSHCDTRWKLCHICQRFLVVQRCTDTQRETLQLFENMTLWKNLHKKPPGTGFAVCLSILWKNESF